MDKISHFRQLETWHKAQKSVLEETRFFPKNLVSHPPNGLVASTERRQ